MKQPVHDDHAPSGFFVLRAPLLPFQTLTALGADLQAGPASGGGLDAAVRSDEAVLLGRLKELVARADVREAIYCASPTLHDGVEAWLRDPASPRARGVTTILVRYLSRMAGRATPFGLFSSCGVGGLGAGPTRLWVGERAHLVRHTRLDMQYLTALVQGLERDVQLRSELRFRPSSSLYRVGDRIQCVEATFEGEQRGRAFRLVSFDASPWLLVALARAEAGALPREIARALLESDRELDEASARSFVDELIDSQVLVSELSPPLTGPEPIHHVIRVLSETAAGASAAAELCSVRDELRKLDSGGLGQGITTYTKVATQLAALPATVEPSRLFQVDLAREDTGARLGSEVLAELARGIAVCKRIARLLPSADLKAFRDAFRARYEDREVPLCEALDDEIGVGFGRTSSVPSPLLDGLRFPNAASAGKTASDKDAYLVRRLLELAERGEHRWELEERDLQALDTKHGEPLPDSLMVSATVAAASAEALARGEFRVAMSGVAGGGANMFGRFCHADPRLHQAVVEHLRAEERLAPDVVFAEIVHLPEGRVGNILCRPLLREHEIPFMGAAGAAPADRLPIEDLLVSVDGAGRARLRSKRLGRWVEPRMTNAHNPGATSLSLYRFLCAVRSQDDEALLGWTWGGLGDSPHLPRVTHGRLVLALEQWSLGREHLEPLAKTEGARRFEVICRLREKLHLPRWVAVNDADNVLPVDLENILSCESFADLVKKREKVVISELFPEPAELAAQGQDGAYVSEIVVPYIARRAPSRARAVPSPPSVARCFAPGSEWLFAKLYAGPDTLDALLRDVVRPLVRRAFETGAADGWFFIRYMDPQFHLRLRLHGTASRLLGEVLPDLHASLAPWSRSGRLHRLVVDTYEREVERYGGDRGIELAEAFFEADSEAVLQIVGASSGDDAELRWRLTLAGMDLLLDDFGFDLERRLSVMQRLRDSFAREHAVDVAVERQLGSKFRAVRASLEQLLEGEHGGIEGMAALSDRSRRLHPVMAELRSLAERGSLTETLESLASSYLHMHANRMLVADHRAQELVLYDFLLRIYQSRAARARRASASQPARDE